MKTWLTEIKAICAQEGIMKTFGGPNVEADSMGEAHFYCQTNGLGYCTVIGQLIAEIPTKGDSFEPDWDKQINYDE